MSDYLENLAIRNIGANRDALVQPRLPAMYESLSPAQGSNWGASPTQAMEEAAAHPRPTGLSFGAATTDGSRPVFMRSPEASRSRPVRIAPGMSATAEGGQPASPRAVPDHERVRTESEANTQPEDLTRLGEAGREAVVEADRRDIAARSLENSQPQGVQLRASATAQPTPDLKKPGGPGSEVSLEAQERDITLHEEEKSREGPARPAVDLSAPQRASGLMKPDDPESAQIREAHRFVPPVLDRKKPHPERARPLADATTENPLVLTSLDPSESEETIKAPRRALLQSTTKGRRQREIQLATTSAAEQRGLDPKKTDQEGSKRVAEVHRHNIVQPNEGRPDASAGSIQVNAEISEPRTEPRILQDLSDHQAPSQGVARSPDRKIADVRQTPDNKKETVPEQAHAFPTASSRPSLAMQGPVPAFRAPVKGQKGNSDVPPTTGADQAPVIRVSIGRVDVRAIMPITPAAPATPPKPRVSLDEYLQRQNEAKR